MKLTKTLLILCLSLYGLFAKSQCPTGDVILHTQMDVDTFVVNYPDCETINGKLIIGYEFGVSTSDITDLSGLSSLDSVKGNFYIRNNPMLTSLEGLNGLLITGTEVLDVVTWNGVYHVIANNDILSSLNGLESLKSVNGIFTISNNDALTDLSGLASFEEIRNDTSTYFEISYNDNLKDLTGLNNLKEVYYLNISDNDNLLSVDGLESLNLVLDFRIENNPKLTNLSGLNDDLVIQWSLGIVNNAQLVFCDVPPVCSFIFGGGNAYIDNNALGCNSPNNISCWDVGLSGQVFYDFNQNQIMDDFEQGMSNQFIKVLPENLNLITSSQGQYFIEAGDGENYIIDWVDDPNWTLTTDSQTYNVTFNPGAVTNSNYDFGLTPSFSSHDFDVNITSGFGLCDTEVKFFVSVENTGTFLESGEIEIHYDSIIEYLFASDIPLIEDQNNQILRFGFQNLYPYTKKEIELTFLMPGADFIGEFAEIETVVFRDEGGTLIEVTDTYYETLIACAFDPNDKQVIPRGVGDEHYTLKNEELLYTLRFQNTGNYFATNVEIRDTLDSNLNWSTFRVINSSHEVYTSITDDGAISFLFQNIFLPAESDDEDGSQGFVTYVIEPKTGLPDYTVIENTGHIYFDSNPPIVTNTTWNTLLDDLATSTLSQVSDRSILVFPNPARYEVNIQNINGGTIDRLTMVDISGQQVLNIVFPNEKIDLSGVSAGIYFLKIETKETLISKKLIIQK